MRIAVIGSGISGLASAYLLRDLGEVHLFEKEDRLGGHSHTVEVFFDQKSIFVDTGFIVFNPHNYPNLVKFFEMLGIESIETDMSFSVSLDDGAMEYEGSLKGLFSQPKNFFSLEYWRMLVDLIRFYNFAPQQIAKGCGSSFETLSDFLKRTRYRPAFINNHLVPMSAAIWSASTNSIMNFPVHTFMAFMQNHKLLNFFNRPQWRTVAGGSINYVNSIAEQLGNRVHLNSKITGLKRGKSGVLMSLRGQDDIWFDKVVMAAHADQSLALLEDASKLESEILSSFKFQLNRAVLHSDLRLMPRSRNAWASWNYLSKSEIKTKDINKKNSDLCLTYWMNRLQSIDNAYPLFETLNPVISPEPNLLHGEYFYRHPIFNVKAIKAQTRLELIQGMNSLYFVGAWSGYGFHEDGLNSAIKVARKLGAKVPWADSCKSNFFEKMSRPGQL